MARSTRESSLSTLAQAQGGYFTAKQAIKLGYSQPLLDYYVSVEGLERVESGLYRLPTVPRSEHDDLIRLSFWSRNQQGEPQAVVSHESALFLHKLTEVRPDRIHLTVPGKFRKSAPKGCILHEGFLTPNQVEVRGGFRVTTPVRTLLDAAVGRVRTVQLAKAVHEAIARGLVQRTLLDAAVRADPRLKRMGALLRGRATAT
jgi:predicted transcriptional regulator of viral defense system